jgi:hypothetical protein
VARLKGPAAKTFLSGRAVLAVVLCAGLAGWGVFALQRTRLAWDGSGRHLGDATALVAELRPDARVTVVGPSPLERLLVPLARHTGRLRVTVVDAAHLAALPPGPAHALAAGDVQVEAGPAWLVLHQPDLATVMAALAATSAPEVQAPGAPPLRPGLDVPAALHAGPGGDGGGGPARARAVAWVFTGLLMPAVVATGGLWWRVRRRGR